MTFHADPTVGFDNSGNAWYVGLAFSQGGSNCDLSLFVTNNTGDLSGPWRSPEVFMRGGRLPNGGPRICHDKPYLAIDNSGGSFSGRLYVSWTRFEEAAIGFKNDIFLTYRNSQTGTWLSPSEIIRLSNDNDSQFSDIDVGPDGTVYVTWVSPVTDAVHLARFEPSNQSFTVSTVRTLGADPLSLSPRGQFQSVAVDKVQANIVYVAYTDLQSGSTTRTDIFLTRSTDRGVTWSAPKRANDDDPPTATDQFFPWITTTKGSTSDGVGRVDIVFYDRRRDPVNNVLYDTFLATSADRGSTIQPNIRVSDFQDDASVLHYLGMVSMPREARPVWTGRAPPGAVLQDVITDRISFFDLEARAVLSTGAAFATAPLVSLDSGAWFTFSRLFSIPPGLHSLTASPCANSGNARFDHWEDASVTISTSSTVTLDVQGDRTLMAVYLEGACLPGDVNKDCAVNILDLVLVGVAFGKSSGQPGFNPDADLNSDGVINILDLVFAGTSFGSSVQDPACPGQSSSSSSSSSARTGEVGAVDGDGAMVEAVASPRLRGETVNGPWLVAGSTFTSSFYVKDAVDLFAWQLNVTFNKAVLNVVSVSLGSYWNQTDGSSNLYFFTTSTSNDTGRLFAALSFVNASSAKQPLPLTSTSDTILVTVTWRVMADESSTPLHIVNTSENSPFGSLIVNSNIATMSYTTLDGSFSNTCTQPCPLSPIAEP